MRRTPLLTCLTVAVALTASGCATKKYVRTHVTDEVAAAETRVGEQLGVMESQIEQNQSELAEQDGRITEVSQTAQEALDRAIAAGKLAEGRFLYETILSSDKVRFGFDEAALTEEAKDVLAAFAEELKARNEDVYVEIQGHTDATGDEAYNLKLGERRAEAVRHHLNHAHGLALHRLSATSYGESAPLVSNDNREERAQNRRVALVVLQ